MATITGDVTIYQDEYCTDYLSGTTLETCEHWTTIYSLEIQDVKELGASIVYNGGIMLSMIIVVLYLLKGIFNKFFSKRG